MRMRVGVTILAHVLLCCYLTFSAAFDVVRHSPSTISRPRGIFAAVDSIDQSTALIQTPDYFKSLDVLKQQCQQCVRKSLTKFSEEGGYYSHVKEQMGTWIDQDLLEDLKLAINDTCLVTGSSFGSYLLSSPLPAASVVFDIDHCSLTLLYVPPEAEVELKTREPGTVLLFRPLLGTGKLSAFNNQRVIQSDTLTKYEFAATGTPVISRLGGPRRTFSCGSSGPAVFLELAFHPRNKGGDFSQSDESSTGSAGSSFSATSVEESVKELSGALQGFTVIQPPQKEFSKLFESTTESVSRMQSIQTKKSFVSEQAEKYDIFDRISYRVGGLGSELKEIVRRVLYSRQISPEVLKSLGLSHVRGILLHGPPGTGKTLIAREIAKALNSREPILVNGPEIMDKYVGEAERNIRELFRPAEEEWATKGKESELHVLIFDEFDSIAKRRGSLSGDGSGVRDSVVNQLLSKLDGVDEMNNILVVALTNRMDLIDPAILRPGRLEVHVEIKVPDEDGRLEILYILFKPLVLGDFLSVEDAQKWSNVLAKRTFGWTGADLTGMLRNAASFAIERSLEKAASIEDGKVDSLNVKILWEDLERAFKESSKVISIPKRMRIRNFLRRNIFRHFSRSGAEKRGEKGGSVDSGTNNRERKSRTFEDILAAKDDFVDYGLQNRPAPREVSQVEREWKDIGGTIVF